MPDFSVKGFSNRLTLKSGVAHGWQWQKNSDQGPKTWLWSVFASQPMTNFSVHVNYVLKYILPSGPKFVVTTNDVCDTRMCRKMSGKYLTERGLRVMRIVCTLASVLRQVPTVFCRLVFSSIRNYLGITSICTWGTTVDYSAVLFQNRQYDTAQFHK